MLEMFESCIFDLHCCWNPRVVEYLVPLFLCQFSIPILVSLVEILPHLNIVFNMWSTFHKHSRPPSFSSALPWPLPRLSSEILTFLQVLSASSASPGDTSTIASLPCLANVYTLLASPLTWGGWLWFCLYSTIQYSTVQYNTLFFL